MQAINRAFVIAAAVLCGLAAIFGGAALGISLARSAYTQAGYIAAATLGATLTMLALAYYLDATAGEYRRARIRARVRRDLGITRDNPALVHIAHAARSEARTTPSRDARGRFLPRNANAPQRPLAALSGDAQRASLARRFPPSLRGHLIDTRA